MATEETEIDSTAEVRELLEALEGHMPAVPEELTEYVLRQCGFSNPDVLTTKLLAVAAQKFLANVAFDALQKVKARTKAPKKVQKDNGYNANDQRLILTTDELAQALCEYGINHKPVPYLVDPPPKLEP